VGDQKPRQPDFRPAGNGMIRPAGRLVDRRSEFQTELEARGIAESIHTTALKKKGEKRARRIVPIRA